LSELYGASDFAHRDGQFAKVVPALVRLFPSEIVGTVATLAELHAISESLDSAMGREMSNNRVHPADYVIAWEKVGRSPERSLQISLTIDVAGQLDRITRNPFFKGGLRLMRAPAAAAGLADLQRFLESGLDTFGAMNGSREFVATVQTREIELVSALFTALPVRDLVPHSLVRALMLLPEAEGE